MDEHRTFALHPALTPYVSSMQGYRIECCRPGTHIGVPSTALTCVFDLTEPLRVTTVDGRRAQHDVLLAGLHTSPVQIHHDGHQHGVMLSLTPLGVRALLGIPASAPNWDTPPDHCDGRCVFNGPSAPPSWAISPMSPLPVGMPIRRT